MCLLWQELRDVPCVEVPLKPGDRWLFFTDGITDRQAPDGTMFDLERLSAALARISAGARRDRRRASSASSMRSPAARSRKTIRRCWWSDSTGTASR